MRAAIKILAVDDDPSITQVMELIFEGPRYHVTTAEDGADALAKLHTTSDAFQIIIIDHEMPNLTGLELVQQIRKRGIAAKLIVLSGRLTPEIRRAYSQAAVTVMLDKPFNVQKLRATVNCLAG